MNKTTRSHKTILGQKKKNELYKICQQSTYNLKVQQGAKWSITMLEYFGCDLQNFKNTYVHGTFQNSYGKAWFSETRAPSSLSFDRFA